MEISTGRILTIYDNFNYHSMNGFYLNFYMCAVKIRISWNEIMIVKMKLLHYDRSRIIDPHSLFIYF
jgi:hypothetical protein